MSNSTVDYTVGKIKLTIFVGPEAKIYFEGD